MLFAGRTLALGRGNPLERRAMKPRTDLAADPISPRRCCRSPIARRRGDPRRAPAPAPASKEGRFLAGHRGRPRRRSGHRSPRLAEIAAGVPVIAEEAAYEGRVPETGAEFFLVDPLDGTKEFVKGGNDFTVNIGLVRDGAPVARHHPRCRRPASCSGASSAPVPGAPGRRRRRRRAPADPRARRPGRADRRRRQPVAPHARDRRLYRAATTSASWSRPAPR